MQIVSDSSTMILLAKTDLLRDVSLEMKIVIPEAVKHECLAKKSLDAEAIATLLREKKILATKVTNRAAVKKLQTDFRIHTGEAEALWLAGEFQCPLAVDDGPTIKACKILGRQFTTAVHFVIYFAREAKLTVPIALEKLDALSRFGRYRQKIIEDASRRIRGENL
jgi:predicted nucleic acid-binding protein